MVTPQSPFPELPPAICATIVSFTQDPQGLRINQNWHKATRETYAELVQALLSNPYISAFGLNFKFPDPQDTEANRELLKRIKDATQCAFPHEPLTFDQVPGKMERLWKIQNTSLITVFEKIAEQLQTQENVQLPALQGNVHEKASQIRMWMREHLEALRQIQSLNLSDLKLATLPPEISLLTALQQLVLSGNKLKALPPEIGRLTALKLLDLSGNKLKTLPLEIRRAIPPSSGAVAELSDHLLVHLQRGESPSFESRSSSML